MNLQKAWRKNRKLAELEDSRINDLRHFFVSMGAVSGVSLPIIGTLLGYTQVQTTARYAHLISEPLKEAAKLRGEKIKKIVN